MVGIGAQVCRTHPQRLQVNCNGSVGSFSVGQLAKLRLGEGARVDLERSLVAMVGVERWDELVSLHGQGVVPHC